MITLSFATKAQNTGESSRLNIGVNPKLPSSKTNANGYLVKAVPSEVSLSKEAAVSEFYKKLLINTKKTSKPAAKVVFHNKEMEDYLFSSEKLVVSNVYPNPANDFAHIEYRIKDKSSKTTLSFHNLLGGQLTALNLNPYDEKVSVPTLNWDDGVYFYQLIVDGKKVATKKLLVRHN